jgi:phosphate transport system protein
MTRHFRHEVELLKKKLLALSSDVEERVNLALRAVLTQDQKVAQQLVDGDTEIDNQEVDVEEECLKILALHQPVAIDLRFIIAALKLNNDLERIADLAVSIANRSEAVAKLKVLPAHAEIKQLGEKVKSSVKRSLDALVEMDSGMAREVLAADDEIDALNRKLHKDLQAAIKADPEQLEGLMSLISISRNLERIGDHATNIAEDVIYMIEGEIVRHGKGGH